MTRTQGSQVDIIYEQLKSGPKTAQELIEAGVTPTKLTCRLTDLRRRLQQRGADWINENGVYTLVIPG